MNIKKKLIPIEIVIKINKISLAIAAIREFIFQ
jgi:hypothetical protein